MVLCRNSLVTESAPASSATVWASPAIARVARAGLVPAVKLVAAAVAPVPRGDQGDGAGGEQPVAAGGGQPQRLGA